MNIGVPREIKIKEGRVALLPRHVRVLVDRGHRVFIERDAGMLAQAPDDEYIASGANIVDTAAALYGESQILLKVKEVLLPEFGLLRRDHVLIGNLFWERDEQLVKRLLSIGLGAVALEKVRTPFAGSNPAAGEVAALEGLRLLLSPHGGPGRHFMRHAGVEPARVLVLGLGAAGRGALRTLLALGATTTGFDIDDHALARAANDWTTRDFAALHITELPHHFRDADLIINCTNWSKDRTDHLISREMLNEMRPGSVIVDVSCDRAGAIETSMPTTWANPTYQVGGITHFCVENLASAIPAAASSSFGDRMLMVAEAVAASGLAEARRRHDWLDDAVVCFDGRLSPPSQHIQQRPADPN